MRDSSEEGIYSAQRHIDKLRRWEMEYNVGECEVIHMKNSFTVVETSNIWCEVVSCRTPLCDSQ